MTSFFNHRWFGYTLVVASFLALIMSGLSSYRTTSYAKCQSMVNEQLIKATTARAQAAADDRNSDQEQSAATAALIRTVFTATTTSERIAAYDTYDRTLADIAKKRAEAAADRAANPLPDPPSRACD